MSRSYPFVIEREQPDGTWRRLPPFSFSTHRKAIAFLCRYVQSHYGWPLHRHRVVELGQAEFDLDDAA